MHERTLTQEQAYRAMLIFLEGIYERTQYDDLGALLGGFALLDDGSSADPAALSDWEDAINVVLGET